MESAKRTALRTFRQEGGFCCRSTHPVSVRQVGLQVGLIAAARRYARRGDHAGLGTAEHRVGGAIAAIAEQRGHALLVGPEPAVGPTAVAAAVHGAPRIGGVSAGGLAGGRKACGAERQSNQDASHVEPLSMMGSASVTPRGAVASRQYMPPTPYPRPRGCGGGGTMPGCGPRYIALASQKPPVPDTVAMHCWKVQKPQLRPPPSRFPPYWAHHG